jgi:hypothetical protein
MLQKHPNVAKNVNIEYTKALVSKGADWSYLDTILLF